MEGYWPISPLARALVLCRSGPLPGRPVLGVADRPTHKPTLHRGHSQQRQPRRPVEARHAWLPTDGYPAAALYSEPEYRAAPGALDSGALGHGQKLRHANAAV